MFPPVVTKRVPVPRAPKTPAAPPVAVVALDSLPERIQRQIGANQRREANAENRERKRKEKNWPKVCHKKLARWAKVNDEESCTGPLENFRVPKRGHPSIISDAGVQQIKEVLLTRDLEGASKTYVPSVRKSAAVIIPGYDPAAVGNSFANLVSEKAREEVLQRNPAASAHSLKPPSGSTLARLAKATEVKKVKVKSHSNERRAGALVDGYNPVSLASVMLILFCSMTGISLPEVECAGPAAFERDPRFLGSISRSLIMNVDKSTSFLGLSQDETLMTGPGSVAALAELSRSVTSVGTEEKRRCVSYTALVRAAGLLVALFSHIKDHIFSGTASHVKPATITLLEGNVLGGPKCFLILNGTHHASSDEDEARMMLRAVFDLVDDTRIAIGMPRVHVAPAGGTAGASGSSKGEGSMGTAGGTAGASGSSKWGGSMGTAGGTAEASGSSKAGGSMGIAGGTAGSGAERGSSNNLASNESTILQIITIKFREQRKRAAREQLDPDEYEHTPPTSDEDEMDDAYPVIRSMGPGVGEVVILEGGGGSRHTVQNTAMETCAPPSPASDKSMDVSLDEEVRRWEPGTDGASSREARSGPVEQGIRQALLLLDGELNQIKGLTGPHGLMYEALERAIRAAKLAAACSKTTQPADVMKGFMIFHQFLSGNMFRHLDQDALQRPAYMQQVMQLITPIDPASRRLYEKYFLTLSWIVSQAYTMSHVSHGWDQAGVGFPPDVDKILTNCPTIAALPGPDFQRVRKACFEFARFGLEHSDKLEGATISDAVMEARLGDLLGPAGTATKSNKAMEERGLIHQRATILENCGILRQEMQRAELREQAQEQKRADAEELELRRRERAAAKTDKTSTRTCSGHAKNIIALNRLQGDPQLADPSPSPGQDWWVCPKAKCKVAFCGACLTLLRKIHLEQAHSCAETKDAPEVDEDAGWNDSGAARDGLEDGRSGGVRVKEKDAAQPRARQKTPPAARKRAAAKKVTFAPEQAAQQIPATPVTLPGLKIVREGQGKSRERAEGRGGSSLPCGGVPAIFVSSHGTMTKASPAITSPLSQYTCTTQSSSQVCSAAPAASLLSPIRCARAPSGFSSEGSCWGVGKKVDEYGEGVTLTFTDADYNSENELINRPAPGTVSGGLVKRETIKATTSSSRRGSAFSGPAVTTMGVNHFAGAQMQRRVQKKPLDDCLSELQTCGTTTQQKTPLLALSQKAALGLKDDPTYLLKPTIETFMAHIKLKIALMPVADLPLNIRPKRAKETNKRKRRHRRRGGGDGGREQQRR
ncbi:hypothetical protein B484DRAFT_473356 [Ochromonadaceae sp. CCMP2298]|nr:hypothetical protein B484DRAFT_473356 [Ochromonadaceae sp. CCMP2298]